MKRDINFIKHIKPQIKNRERVDKATSKQLKWEKVRRVYGLPEPALNVDDLGVMASLIRRLRRE